MGKAGRITVKPVGEIKLSVSVMAHPTRAWMVDELLRKLRTDGKYGYAEGVEVIWERGYGEWDTGSRAWAWGMEQNSTHHLVIQDDVIPCKDMLAGVEWALRGVPEGELMGLFYGSALLAELEEGGGLVETQRHKQVGRAVDLARAIEASWITMCGPIWGPAFVVPTAEIRGMLAWCYDRTEVYDQRITLWCIEKGKKCYQTFPCFAEHRDQPSLVLPGRTHARVARQFLGEHVSALTFNPHGPVVNCR